MHLSGAIGIYSIYFSILFSHNFLKQTIWKSLSIWNRSWDHPSSRICGFEQNIKFMEYMFSKGDTRSRIYDFLGRLVYGCVPQWSSISHMHLSGAIGIYSKYFSILFSNRISNLWPLFLVRVNFDLAYATLRLFSVRVILDLAYAIYRGDISILFSDRISKAIRHMLLSSFSHMRIRTEYQIYGIYVQ